MNLSEDKNENTVILTGSGDIDDLIYSGEDWHESEK